MPSSLPYYDPNIWSQDDIPDIDADVILCLPDNGRRLRKEVMPPEGYRVIYS